MLRRKQIWSKFIVLIPMVLLLCCSQRSKTLKKAPIPEPEAAIAAVAHLDSILGYAFSWEFNRKRVDMMPEMRAQLAGRVCVPDRIFISGTWKTGGTTARLNHYSIEGREYLFNKASEVWERGTSGSFLDPHEHLKLVLSFGAFSFEGYDVYKQEECYIFSFKPNVYFLDPVEISEPAGEVWISIKERIPLRVEVTSKGGVLFWKMELSHIDEFADLNVPFQEMSFRIPRIEHADDIETIVRRFLYLGFSEPVAVNDGQGALISVKAEHLSDATIESMLKRGSVELLLGVWPEHPIYILREDTSLLHAEYGEGAQLLFEQGVVTKPIISIRSLLKDDAFEGYELRNDLLGAFSLYATISKGALDSLSVLISSRQDEPVVALVDGVPMLISNIRDAWIVEQQIPIAKGLEGKKAVRMFARLREKPLREDYSFERIEKEE